MEETENLKKLRAPFPEHQISLLPRPTKKKEQCRPNQKCADCGGWHTPDVIHLKYVGHAALTDRLLDCDPCWVWEPLAYTPQGLPAFDHTDGLWIRLTVCGVTRIGYGNAEPSSFKEVGTREKEVIGDALRNAAMRFGCALELWHKGVLHIDEPADAGTPEPEQKEKLTEPETDWLKYFTDMFGVCKNLDQLKESFSEAYHLHQQRKISDAIYTKIEKIKNDKKEHFLLFNDFVR